MIRPLIELYTQRTLDNGSRPTGWLGYLVDRDEKLRQFVDDHLALDDALTRSAAERREALARQDAQPVETDWLSASTTLPRPSAAPPARVRSRLAWACSAAVAASLLIALLVAHSNAQQARAAQAQMLAQQMTAVPNGISELLTLAVHKTQAGVAHYRPTKVVVYPRRSTERLIESVDHRAKLANDWLSKMTDPVDRIRSRLQRQSPLDQGQEDRQLESS